MEKRDHLSNPETKTLQLRLNEYSTDNFAGNFEEGNGITPKSTIYQDP